VPGLRHRRAGHIPALDGLRGVAVGLVLLNHFLVWEPTTTAERILTAITSGGWAGVDLFFVLSGYLISGIVLDHDGPGFLRAFYTRRALRIIPPYVAFLALLGALLTTGVVGAAGDFEQFRRALPWLATFTNNIRLTIDGGFGVVRGLAGHLWSVAVEEQFYLAWPLLLLTVPRRRTMQLVVAAIVGAFAFRCVLELTGAPHGAAFWLMPSRMDALAIGAGVAVWERDRGLAQSVRGPSAALWCAALAVLLVLVTAVYRLSPVAIRTAELSLVPLAFGALLVVALRTSADAPLRRLLEMRWLRATGTYSYAIYLFHMLAFPTVAHMGAGRSLTAHLCIAAGAIVASVALARVSWWLVEAPALAYKDRFPYPPARPVWRQSRLVSMQP
jgi:peptidoglycan/LPS O-acetylase OafA/YrhL